MEKIVVTVRAPYDERRIRALGPCVLHLPLGSNDPAVIFCREPPDLTGLDAFGYQVEERLQWDYERTWSLGSPSPGIKQLSFVRRVAGITHQEFVAHWTSVHAPLARRHHPTLWRYVQNDVLRPATAHAAEVDGIAELSFRDPRDATERMYDSPEGKEIIRRDVAEFIDIGAGWRVKTLEHVLVL